MGLFKNSRSLPPVLLMTDADRWQPGVEALRVSRRPFALVLRHRRDERLKAMAGLYAGWRRRPGQLLLVARSQAVALSARADGVHLAETQLLQPGRLNLRQMRRRFIVSAACHSLPAARRAQRYHVAFAVLSPVKPTASHPGRHPVSARMTHRCVQTMRGRIYALGGMTLHDQCMIKKKGFQGIAGVGLGKKLLGG